MPVACFAKLVETGFRAICADQHVLYIQFLPRLARKKSNVPKLKISLFGLPAEEDAAAAAAVLVWAPSKGD